MDFKSTVEIVQEPPGRPIVVYASIGRIWVETKNDLVDVFQYEKMAYRIMIRQFGIHPDKDEDMKQVAMMALVKARNAYRPELGFKFTTFAWNSIRNEILNELKRRKKSTWLTTQEILGHECELGRRDEEKPEFTWSDIEKDLPSRTSQVIRKRFWEHETLKTIGDSMSITRERVRQIEREGLDRIRKSRVGLELAGVT